jgi:hypothetical protein
VWPVMMASLMIDVRMAGTAYSVYR